MSELIRFRLWQAKESSDGILCRFGREPQEHASVLWTGSVAWFGAAFRTRRLRCSPASSRWGKQIVLVGLGGFLDALALSRSQRLGLPMVCMDARRASDALKARAEKTDKADARALAEMLASGWYSAVHVKSLESHQLKALLGARDQLVRVSASFTARSVACCGPSGSRYLSGPAPSLRGSDKLAGVLSRLEQRRCRLEQPRDPRSMGLFRRLVREALPKIAVENGGPNLKQKMSAPL